MSDKSKSINIHFAFPDQSPTFKEKGAFVESILYKMRQDGSIKWTGYRDEKDFQDDLLSNIGAGDTSLYKPISITQKEVIEEKIFSSVEKCHNVLPHPDLPIFVFVYPWFPDTNNRVLFKSVTAFSAYYTMHLFVELDTYSEESLEQTIAHEWNHLVFYRYHIDQPYSLRKYMVMEGLAEVFRETVMGGDPAPWAMALTDDEVEKCMNQLGEKLDMKSMETYREVFWEGKKYKRWTGYSIGYRLAKKLRNDHPSFSWEELIKKGV